MTNAPVAADAVIRVTDLKKHYGDVHAVDGVSFEVRPGEIFGLLGPNGAGKTTTVEILEGLREPDSGEVRVLGLDVAKDADALKPRIGVSLQTAALYPKLTVTELIDLFRSFYPKSRPTAELIEALGLTERSKAQSKDLSGGQRQRLAVALSLVNDPELVFLDEPTTGLDPAARRSLWTLIEELKAAGTSVLLTTHYMEEAEILCDRLAIMDHGKVLELGTVEQLVSKHFKDRAVRFDPDRGARHGAARVVARRSARSTSTTPTRWSSRATSGRRSARSSPRPRDAGSSRRTCRSGGRRSRTCSSA